MKKTFYNREQAYNYLVGTVVRVKGKPAYVMQVDYKDDDEEDLLVSYELLPGPSKMQYIEIDDPDFDMTPVDLGYLSINNKPKHYTGWCARYPARKWKIGLCPQNLLVTQLPGYRHAWDKNALILSEELRRTIMNEYPDCKKAISWSKEIKQPVAFSKRFAVDEKSLFHSFHQVPVGIVDGWSVELNEDMEFLKEALEEDVR